MISKQNQVFLVISLCLKCLIGEKKILEISTGNTPGISTSNTPKSHDFQGKSRFFSDIALPEISTVESSGGNKNKIRQVTIQKVRFAPRFDIIA